MRLWTILTQASRKRLNECGHLICDDEALVTKELMSAYRCMVRQMSALPSIITEPRLKLPFLSNKPLYIS